jgi:hypothetical protein
MPKRFGLLLPFFLAVVSSAATIDFTFKAITAEASFNGKPAAKIDLSVDLLADTSKFLKGGGIWGSDRYRNLKAYFSSKALGLSNVEAAAPLGVDIGAPSADPTIKNCNCTILMVSSNDGNIVNGIFNLRALEAWDRVSSIGPLLGPATASVPLSVVLKNGDTLSISTLESAQPFGNASFQAHILPDHSLVETGAAPVTGSLRKLAEKDLYLQTAGNNVMRFRLLAKTSFRDKQGEAIRDSLLRPGDQLSVIVSPDDPETAVGVVLIRKHGI